MFLVHQPMAGGAAKSCFQSGDRVVVQFADAGWCPGVVSARGARRDGKGSIYKVTFDDGEVWNDVSPSDMEYEEDIHAVKRRKRSCIMQPTGAANSDSNQEAEATVEPAASHGDRVIARDSRGNWCEGKVVDNDEDGNRVKVHFKGWGSRWDEWISFGTGRLRPLPLLADYDVGDFLTARNLQESWCRAKVLGTRNYHLGGPQQLHVHFFGHAAKLDEWIDVDSGRLRPLLIGERVLARDSSGNWISATVTGERDEDNEARQLKVSFDGWAARWDEWILVASGRLQRLKTEEGPPDDSKPNKVKAEPPSPKQDLRRGGSELHGAPQDSAGEQQSRRRRVPSEPHEAPQGALKVGQRVRARFLASSRGPSIANKWYAGVITAANVDGTYNIRYDDEDEETDVLSKFVQPLLDGASEEPPSQIKQGLDPTLWSVEDRRRRGASELHEASRDGAANDAKSKRLKFNAPNEIAEPPSLTEQGLHHGASEPRKAPQDRAGEQHSRRRRDAKHGEGVGTAVGSSDPDAQLLKLGVPITRHGSSCHSRGGSELHELPQDSASEQQSRRRRVPSEPHEAPQGALKVGQRVRARFLASSRGPSIANKWYAGVITAANVDGTYNIRYDDEDEETDVLSKFVQPLLDGASEAPHGASWVKKFRSSEPPARNGLRQASAVNVAGALKVGQRVRARFLASSQGLSAAKKWYPGVITATNVDGTYNIRYDDEDEEADVLSKFVQPLPDGANEEPPARNGTREAAAVKHGRALELGQRVRARFLASSQGPSIAKTWYPGVITATNVDGTYDIRYDDKDEEADVLSEFVQPLPEGASEEPPARNHTREATAVETGQQPASPGAAARQHSAIAAQRLLLLAQSHVATAPYSVGASTVASPQLASGAEIPQGVANGLDALRQHITCPICHRMLVRAQVLPCQHAFCEECIHNVLRATSPNSLCVVCKSPFFRREISASTLLQHIVDTYQAMAAPVSASSPSS